MRRRDEGVPNLAPGGDPDPNLQIAKWTAKKQPPHAELQMNHKHTIKHPPPQQPTAQPRERHPRSTVTTPTLLIQLPTPLTLIRSPSRRRPKPAAAQDDTFAISLSLLFSLFSPPSCVPSQCLALSCFTLLLYSSQGD